MKFYNLKFYIFHSNCGKHDPVLSHKNIDLHIREFGLILKQMIWSMKINEYNFMRVLRNLVYRVFKYLHLYN